MRNIFIFLFVFALCPYGILLFGKYIAPFFIPYIEWILTPVL